MSGKLRCLEHIRPVFPGAFVNAEATLEGGLSYFVAGAISADSTLRGRTISFRLPIRETLTRIEDERHPRRPLYFDFMPDMGACGKPLIVPHSPRPRAKLEQPEEQKCTRDPRATG